MSNRFIHSFILACLLALPSAPSLAVAPDFNLRMVHSVSGTCMHTKSRKTHAGANVIVHRRGCSLDGLSDGEIVKMAFFYDAKAKRIRHPGSGLCVVPRDYIAVPREGHFAVLGDCKADVAKFDHVENRYLRHLSGTCLIPKPGRGKNLINVNDDASVIFGGVCVGNSVAWVQSDLKAPSQAGDTFLVHRFSGKCARPDNFRHNNNTQIKLRSSGCNRKLPAMVFTMLPSGAIQHQASGKCIHPYRGHTHPGNNTYLVLHDGCWKQQLRFFKLANGAVQHIITGRCIHPHGGDLIPNDNTRLVLHDGCHEQTTLFDWRVPGS